MSLKYLFPVFLTVFTFEKVNGMENNLVKPNFSSSYDLRYKPLNPQFVLLKSLNSDDLHNLHWAIADLKAEKDRLTRDLEADKKMLRDSQEMINIPPQEALAPSNQRRKIPETFLIEEHDIPEAEKKIKDLSERFTILNNYKTQHRKLLETLPPPNFDNEKAWGYSFLVNQPMNPNPALTQPLSDRGSNRLQNAIKELLNKQEETKQQLDQAPYDYSKEFSEIQLEDVTFRMKALTGYWNQHLSFLDTAEKEKQTQAFQLLLEKKEEQAPQIENQIKDPESDDPELQAALKAAEEEYQRKIEGIKNKYKK